jgi:fatty acid synthase subunit alpha
VVTQEDASQFKLEHGEKVDVFEKDGKWLVSFKKGASMYLPRALHFDRFVAGQIPTGWDASRYGLPQDIINQVDKITLYNLVSTVEAFVSAGNITIYSALLITRNYRSL